ncbi:MAG: D-glycero-beta-D-manno-heptose 1-phosphate adenylyltransferase [Deltaproteobacteria bacterium]|nr:D-glycero-beta-D-manno-heptose 1-phosphate adenylyltransferase [Deltaproteobacteria bacterium]
MGGVVLGIAEVIMPAQRLASLVAEEQEHGKKIVFTNGCFDLLHPGHVSYLAAARALGDLLIVGVNSDASVRRLKGEKRPIMPEAARAQLLAALASVDYVTLFGEDDPYQLISLLKPDILVKGGDWNTASIVGRDLVEARGGKVYALPFVDAYSTTSIVEEILRRYA